MLDMERDRALSKLDSREVQTRWQGTLERLDRLDASIQAGRAAALAQVPLWHARTRMAQENVRRQEDVRFARSWAERLMAEIWVLPGFDPESTGLVWSPEHRGWIVAPTEVRDALRLDGRVMADGDVRFLSCRPWASFVTGGDLNAWLKDATGPWVIQTQAPSPVHQSEHAGAELEIVLRWYAQAVANECVLEPYGPWPMELVRAVVEGPTMSTQLVTPTAPIWLDGPVALHFASMPVQTLILRFRQRHSFLGAHPGNLPPGAPSGGCVYRFGLQDLQLRWVSYPQAGEATVPLDHFPEVASARALALVVEEHPTNTSPPDTAWHYELSADGVHFYPVQPVNVAETAEKLTVRFEQGAYAADLRMQPADPNDLVLWQNTRRMDPSEYVLQGLRRVVLADYDPTSTYVARYPVAPAHHRLDAWKVLQNQGVIAVQDERVVDPMGHGLELSAQPWIDRGLLFAQADDWDPSYLSHPDRPNHYVPIQLTVEEPHGVTWTQPPFPGAQGLFLFNRTDYRGQGRDFFEPVAPMVRERLALTGESWVRLSYPYIVDKSWIVSFEGQEMVDGVDYVLDASTGRIRRLGTGHLPDGAEVVVEYRWSGNPWGPEVPQLLQYRVRGRRLEFNRPLLPGTRIVASYSAFAPRWVLRVRGLRLFPGASSTTPVLHRLGLVVYRAGILDV